MSEIDRNKWNEKHALAADATDLQVPNWLNQQLDMLPRGRALDLACGLGNTAIELVRKGWNVTAIDISEVAIERAAQAARRQDVQVAWVVADLDHVSLPHNHFDLITIFNYLDRQRLPGQVVHSLRPGGMLVYETYTVDQLAMPDNHLRNPAYLLQPGELLTMFCGLRVRAYRDVTLAGRAVASLVGQKVSGEW